MPPPQPEALYNQVATGFSQRFFIRGKTEVEGRFMLELANTFLSDLLFPGCRPISLDTKLPGMGRTLNMGEFSERRWNASARKILAGQYAVVGIRAQSGDFPNQTISLTVHVNPPGGTEFLTAGNIDVHCSIPYLRHLAGSPQKVEALLQFGQDHMERDRGWSRVRLRQPDHPFAASRCHGMDAGATWHAGFRSKRPPNACMRSLLRAWGT